mgnify:FL=1
MWKDFFYYTRSERRAILCLLGVTVLFLAVCLTLRWQETAGLPPETTQEVAVDSFLTEVRKQELSRSRRTVTYRRPKKERAEIVLQPFDPNVADSVLLCRVGFPSFMARNLIRYRSKGGVFRTPESLKRIYGMTDSLYQTLEPYITIGPDFQHRDTLPWKTAPVDSLEMKYAEGTVIELNHADTVQLKRIPGIGRGLARMIVAYRQRLGGFVSVDQLQEIPHLEASVNKWFRLDTTGVRRLLVNRYGLDRLRSHPYMDFYKAKAILEYRRKYGKIKGLSQLSLWKEFSEKDLKRLAPYLSFE